MAEIGYFLSSEEHSPPFLVRTARQAEEAAFRSVMISDHYHPWTDRQGESPFVWSVIGAIAATTELRVTTGVTCPTVRIHPAVIAQAAATSQLLLNGRFRLGVGTGEALNEHVAGDRWPPADVRLEMLEEAVTVIRQLWRGGMVNHHGRHYTVENARIYSLPDQPPPILISGFGPKAISLAARIGDGFVSTSPAPDSLRSYEQEGGKGPKTALIKACWGEDEAAARKLAFDVWPTSGVPGELNQELPTPAHFEHAASIVTEDMVAAKIACGPDPERHAGAIRQYLEAGYDEVYVSQVGDEQAGYFDFFTREVKPRLGL
ncbi:MAG TPA: TIGR03557 family F420-dependent LLM class oxidoreductase [Acidimicrobiales bacterium]|nr:TIGR03557 family F420-dependent LLM class oxidoreductase [Acidimicrobiales bacterium]